MLNRLTVIQKGILLVLLPVAFELFFVYLLSTELSHAQAGLKTILRERAVIVQLNQINVSMMRTLLLIFTPGPKDDPYILQMISKERKRAIEMKSNLSHMTNVSAEIADVCQQFDKILSILMSGFSMAENIINDPSIPSGRRNQHMDPFLLLRAFGENRRLTKKIDRMEEQFQLRVPAQLSEIQNRLITILTLGIGTGCLLSFLLSKAFSQDITRRLKAISVQAPNVFQGNALTKPQEGIDEIARLDKTLHQAAMQYRQARLREQAILHNAADVICSLDAKFRFVGVSQVAEKRWRRSELDLIGAPVANILTEDSIAQTLDALEKIAGEGSGEFENKITLPDAVDESFESFAEFQWSVRWSKEEKRYFCTVHDVTELRAVERLKEKFLSIVSHDLRAPITSIGISLDLLRKGKHGDIPEKAVGVLDRTDSSLSTLTVLVNELLDLDKLQAGKMSLNSAVVSARGVCAKALDSLTGLAESAGVELDLTNTDCSLWADELRLTQAMTNLLSNAIKFSPRGSRVRIEIAVESEAAELQVIDQGPGVPESEKPYVFDKFKQTSVQSNIKGKGSGLGLAIVRAIAEAHNGAAGVKNAAPQGSIFYLRIPRLSSSPESDA